MFTEENLDKTIKICDAESYSKTVICIIGEKTFSEFIKLNKEEQEQWLDKYYLKRWFWLPERLK